MSDIQFGPRLFDPALCSHEGHVGDWFTRCDSPAIPGGTECADCLIRRTHYIDNDLSLLAESSTR